MDDLEVVEEVPKSVGADEAGSLAIELARAYHQMTTFYRDQLGLSAPEADVRARVLDHSPQEAADDLARIRARPPDQLSWFDLSRLATHNPDALADIWAELRTEAMRELETGHRSAQAQEWRGRPWQRARYLAIRDSFQAENPSHGGVEGALVDIAAEAFNDYMEWTEQYHMRASSEAEMERDQLERDGRWSPPHLSTAESLEQASKMADRAHTRFLRTIKMLRELQRSIPTLFVGHAEQINLGSQQVNLSQSPAVTEDPLNISPFTPQRKT